MIEDIKPLIGKLTSFAKQRMGFEHPPKLFLRKDSENSKKLLGKTAHYDPERESVTLFVTGRHPKDILRSLAHELVHHTQNLRGEFNKEMDTSPGYAQKDNHMRDMEKEAYLDGNMCFRDWEDNLDDKDTYTIKLAESKFLKENKTMTTKTRVTKKFLQEMIEKQLKKSIKEGDGSASDIAPSHYCIHHGGVQHEGAIWQGEAIGHNWNEELGKVTHYDMKLSDGTILENVAAEDILVTKASLAEGSYTLVGECTHKRHDVKKKKVKETEEVDGEVVEEDNEELEEGEISEVSDEVKARTAPRDKANKADFLPKDVRDEINNEDDDDDSEEETQEESKIQTPEQENTLYEQRFTPKNEKLFEKLIKQWTK